MEEMNLMVIFSLLGGVSDNSVCCHISIKQNVPTGSYLVLSYKLTFCQKKITFSVPVIFII
ncbi:hypothetical protein DAI22_11g047300 [Oryza sativa Japonica Group]|nr:hypothetical protein DAI22_11g047300 [Oryza sativa Japonica Group]